MSTDKREAQEERSDTSYSTIRIDHTRAASQPLYRPFSSISLSVSRLRVPLRSLKNDDDVLQKRIAHLGHALLRLSPEAVALDVEVDGRSSGREPAAVAVGAADGILLADAAVSPEKEMGQRRSSSRRTAEGKEGNESGVDDPPKKTKKKEKEKKEKGKKEKGKISNEKTHGESLPARDAKIVLDTSSSLMGSSAKCTPSPTTTLLTATFPALATADLSLSSLGLSPFLCLDTIGADRHFCRFSLAEQQRICDADKAAYHVLLAQRHEHAADPPPKPSEKGSGADTHAAEAEERETASSYPTTAPLYDSSAAAYGKPVLSPWSTKYGSTHVDPSASRMSSLPSPTLPIGVGSENPKGVVMVPKTLGGGRWWYTTPVSPSGGKTSREPTTGKGGKPSLGIHPTSSSSSSTSTSKKSSKSHPPTSGEGASLVPPTSAVHATTAVVRHEKAGVERKFTTGTETASPTSTTIAKGKKDDGGREKSMRPSTENRIPTDAFWILDPHDEEAKRNAMLIHERHPMTVEEMAYALYMCTKTCRVLLSTSTDSHASPHAIAYPVERQYYQTLHILHQYRFGAGASGGAATENEGSFLSPENSFLSAASLSWAPSYSPAGSVSIGGGGWPSHGGHHRRRHLQYCFRRDIFLPMPPSKKPPAFVSALSSSSAADGKIHPLPSKKITKTADPPHPFPLPAKALPTEAIQKTGAAHENDIEAVVSSDGSPRFPHTTFTFPLPVEIISLSPAVLAPRRVPMTCVIAQRRSSAEETTTSSSTTTVVPSVFSEVSGLKPLQKAMARPASSLVPLRTSPALLSPFVVHPLPSRHPPRGRCRRSLLLDRTPAAPNREAEADSWTSCGSPCHSSPSLQFLPIAFPSPVLQRVPCLADLMALPHHPQGGDPRTKRYSISFLPPTSRSTPLLSSSASLNASLLAPTSTATAAPSSPPPPAAHRSPMMHSRVVHRSSESTADDTHDDDTLASRRDFRDPSHPLHHRSSNAEEEEEEEEEVGEAENDAEGNCFRERVTYHVVLAPPSVSSTLLATMALKRGGASRRMEETAVGRGSILARHAPSSSFLEPPTSSSSFLTPSLVPAASSTGSLVHLLLPPSGSSSAFVGTAPHSLRMKEDRTDAEAEDNGVTPKEVEVKVIMDTLSSPSSGMIVVMSSAYRPCFLSRRRRQQLVPPEWEKEEEEER